MSKIVQTISECQYGIHDISRTQLDPINQLPRYNMPLELGLFLGAKHYGDKIQRQKNCLILDKEKFRYQKFISDLAGNDIGAHADLPQRAIKLVRNWLAASIKKIIPSGDAMWDKYKLFQKDLPKQCALQKMNSRNLTFVDFTTQTEMWLDQYSQLNIEI